MEQVLTQPVVAAEAVEKSVTIKAKEIKEVLVANEDRVNFTITGAGHELLVSYVSKKNIEEKKGYGIPSGTVRTEDLWPGVVWVSCESEVTFSVQELTQKNRQAEDEAFEPKAPTVVEDGPGFTNAPSSVPGAGE
jgi:hypothetical protein